MIKQYLPPEGIKFQSIHIRAIIVHPLMWVMLMFFAAGMWLMRNEDEGLEGPAICAVGILLVALSPPVWITALYILSIAVFGYLRLAKKREEGYLTTVYAMFFVPLDILFNWTVGTFVFWEWPTQQLFTDRCEEHKWEQAPRWTPASKILALFYCKRMDKYDPGHCA